MYNNYGFNPYYQQQRFQTMPQQPIETNMNNIQTPIINNGLQNRQMLSGKSVESIEVVKAMDIPLDGSISYFPIADGSAIVTKQLQLDGTSKTTIFKPIEEEKGKTRYITQDDLKKSLESLNISEIEDLKEEIEQLKNNFKEFQKKMKSKGD